MEKIFEFLLSNSGLSSLGVIFAFFLAYLFYVLRTINTEKREVAEIKLDTVKIKDVNEANAELITTLAQKFNLETQLNQVGKEQRAQYLFESLKSEENLRITRLKNSQVRFYWILSFSFVFLIALTSVAFLRPEQLNDKTNKKKEEIPPIEEAQPLFDSTHLYKKKNKKTSSLIAPFHFQTASFKNGLEIVHTRRDKIDGLPVVYFTMMNKSGEALVLNKFALDIIYYEPDYAKGGTEYARLEPLVVWDTPLPHNEGYFPYQPKNAVLLPINEAVNVGIRFYCLSWSGRERRLSPYEGWRLKVVFLTDNANIKVTSEEFEL